MYSSVSSHPVQKSAPSFLCICSVGAPIWTRSARRSRSRDRGHRRCGQSIGSEYKGPRAGSMGQIGCFSFFVE